jgi:hypothetical protein
LTSLEQECVVREIESLGFDVERLATRYEARAAYNIHAFDKLEIKSRPFALAMKELF